jgi:exosortase A
MWSAALAVGGNARELTPLALIAGVVTVVVALYADTFASMAAIWQSSGYHHGLIVPPISAYLLWRLRGSLAATEARPCAWAILPLIATVALWFVSRAVAVQVVEYFAAMLLIPLAVVAFLGWPLARKALFPLFFLLAAVPIGDGLIPQLMLVTADVSTALLRAAGVPVFREGQFLTLPGGSFEVASVCAGLAYLTAGTVIALLFSYLTYRSVLKRVLFVVSTMAVMIVTNGVRAFIVMYVASATDLRYLAGQDHILFGWILFALTLVALVAVGARFGDQDPREGNSPTNAAQRPRLLPVAFVLGLAMLAATAQPLQTGLGDSWLWLWPITGLLIWTIYKRLDARRPGQAPTARGNIFYRSVQGVVVLAIAPVVLASGPGLLSRPETQGYVEPVTFALPAVDGCLHAGAWSERWRPEFRQPDRLASGTYLCSGRPVNAFVATYVANTQGRELVNHNNKAVPDALRYRAGVGKGSFASAAGKTILVNELHVDQSAASSLIWYWYETDDTAATSPVVVKLNQALRLLLSRRTEATVYVLQTSVDGPLDMSREPLMRVARRLVAEGAFEPPRNVSLAGDPAQ